jgi:hypothetical protein
MAHCGSVASLSSSVPSSRYSLLVLSCGAWALCLTTHQKKLLRIFLPPFVVLALGLFASAQIEDVTNSTSTPIAGAGHDYIKMLSETVNPSNGSVSVRIQTPTPSRRGISLPFAFGYDSNGAAHVTSDGKGRPYWTDNSSYLAQGGWSYSVPLLSTESVVIQMVPKGFCSYFKDYIFQDATGGRHSLGVASVEDPNVCHQGNQYPVPVLNGGDDYYRANSGGTIADAAGTVYTFSDLGNHSQGLIVGAGSSLVSSIEDRNGNKVVVTDLDWGGNGISGAFTANDPLGRTLLSSSGFGVSGNTVAVSGLANPYTVTWGSSSLNFSVNSWLLHGSNCGSLPRGGGTGGTENVIKNILLPNGKSYQFSYDPAYGTV